MDELDRGGRDDVEVPKTIIGAESTKRKKAEAEARFQERIHASDPGSALAEQLRLAYEQLKATKIANVKVKPQKEYGFESAIDNSTNPFIPKLKTKHNALPRKETSGMTIIDEGSSKLAGATGQGDLSLDYEADVSHPYQQEIQNFVVPSSQLESKEPIEPVDIQENSVSMIKTKEDLERLRDVLNNCQEFAVDLEARKNVDISTELPNEEGPSHTAKRIKKDDKADEVPSYTVNRIKVDDEDEESESFDYSKFDKNAFNQSPTKSDNSFDPFNQKHRIENKKNFRRRGRGGHHRMGTMSIGYKPSSKK
ncbi:hypothetical protein TELCIR_10086 [Teladorsagia circumcincta]|uniref:Uncharacterized protein n=1 Tax=Teladorsagia circumcincta TaxID=45464 RepID=A0A2G9UD25_TELCI|nr:hypothetical protein TELCIR_10086 [Teladorsagia circumcincta]